MAQFVSPGVYIIERDFSDYVASLQQTSLGMVGTALRGPLNEPTLCTSPEQFINTFGPPTSNMYGPFAALNFLRRASQLFYCRVAKTYTDDVATVLSLGSPTNGLITSLTVTSNHGITAPVNGVPTSYIRVRQSGMPTSANLPVSAVSTDTITVSVPLVVNTYTTAATVDLSATADSANSAEVNGYTRKGGVVTPVVRFTAANEGAWANFGTSSGVEIVIEDSGTFQNVDPTTGNVLQSVGNVPLVGMVTTAPSVDTKVDLLSLTAAMVRNGEQRGVNQDSLVGKVTNVALTSNVASVTLDSTTGLMVGDSIVISNVANATGSFNGTYSLTGVGGNVVTFAKTHADVTSAAATPTDASIIMSAEKQNSNTFGTVYKATVASNVVTWTVVGVLTKRVRVLFAGRQVEVFENLIGYDSTSLNYWDTVIGTPDAPVSKYITAEYMGAVGEAPMNSYNKTNFAYNPRLLMGALTSVRVAPTSVASSVVFTNAVGTNGDNPGSTEIIGEIDENGNYSGLQNFRRSNEFDINLLCVPASTSPDVLNEIISITTDRADCLGILDTPLGFTVQEAVDWHNGTGAFTGDHAAFVTDKCAMYYPWVQVFDPYVQRNIWLPPSAFVPGVMAFTDQTRDVWFAPAGMTRGPVPGALKVEHVVTQGEFDYMYGPGNGNALNPIMSYKQEGIVVYGERTLQRVPSALDRVGVRRALFYIEKTISTSCRTLVFEQDDPILWAQLTALLVPFLTNLKGRRCLEDFRVVCDITTNTEDRRNNNEVGAKILLIPVKSAEKITLEFTLLPSGASFDEFVASNQ